MVYFSKAMEPQILAKAFRGDQVESIHRGHLFIMEGDGRIAASLGDPGMKTFFRSAAKPFQLAPFLVAGGAAKFGFEESEIALACGSHSGEAVHAESSAGMLSKIGLSESDLHCGAHLPFNEKASEGLIRGGKKPNQFHNNCSGKHAAMLAFAKLAGVDIATYESPENPVQKKILESISSFSGIPQSEIGIAIDGCAAPNFAIPVSAMAASYARLVFPPKEFRPELQEVCRRIVAAMMNHPEMVGGSGRLDTLIMQAAKGRIVSKIGADGIYCAGILPSERWRSGLGIAFKVEDGDDKRARPAIAIEVLRQLGAIDENGEELIGGLSPLPVLNRKGDEVGKVCAAFPPLPGVV